MITFVEGPGVARQGLLLRRAPFYLRVVVDETDGAVDGLDQLDDTPGPSERVHVYRRVSHDGPVFLCGRGRGVPSGRFETATYEHVPDVDGEQLRDTDAWRQWCHAQPEARPQAEVAG